MARFEKIVGRYVHLEVDGVEYRVYVEESGQGIPLLAGHTAGSDGRQYRHLMNDAAVTDTFRVIAYDLPFHGKSLPPSGVEWWTSEYNLTKRLLIGVTNAVADAFECDQPVYLGCSMGGHLAVDLAAEHPGRYRATIGLEGAMRSAAELVEAGVTFFRRQFDNPNVGPAAIGAGMVGNIAPMSPEASVREVLWEYSSGGPGVFAGDMYYYYNDHVLSEADALAIDTSKCMLYLLTGEYDPSPTPAETRRLADLVPGAEFVEMPGLGHFPMIENYPRFRPFLLDVLSRIIRRAGSPASGSPGTVRHVNDRV